MVAIADKVYLFGGMASNNTILNDLWVFNPSLEN